MLIDILVDLSTAVPFDVDYLENLKMEDNSDSNTLSRDSIYVKFDPLVNKMSLKASDSHTIVPSEAPEKRLRVSLYLLV